MSEQNTTSSRKSILCIVAICLALIMAAGICVIAVQLSVLNTTRIVELATVNNCNCYCHTGCYECCECDCSEVIAADTYKSEAYWDISALPEQESVDVSEETPEYPIPTHSVPDDDPAAPEPVDPPKPSTEPPTEENPEEEPPTEETPEEEPPTEETPEEEPPTEETPEEEPPTEETPEEEPPTEETPEEEPPTEETPEEEPPTEETPEKEPPTEETPEKEPPTEETPEKEPPTEETPEKEPPTEEPPKEDTSHFIISGEQEIEDQPPITLIF